VDLKSEDGFHFLFPVSGGSIKDGDKLEIRYHSDTPTVSEKINLNKCFESDGKKLFTELIPTQGKLGAGSKPESEPESEPEPESETEVEPESEPGTEKDSQK